MRAISTLRYLVCLLALRWASASPIWPNALVPETDYLLENVSIPLSSTCREVLSKRAEWDYSRCQDPDQAVTLALGYNEAKLLVAAAERSLVALNLFLAGSPSRDQALVWNPVLLDTYEAIYGRAINEDSGSLNGIVKSQLRDLISAAQRMRNALNNNLAPIIEIYCDTDWMIPQGIDKQGVPVFKDNRPQNRGGQQILRFPPGRCDNQYQRYYAFTGSYVPIGLDLTVYCPQHFTSWRFNRLTALINSAIPNTYYFNNIDRDYIGLTVMHKLMHSRNILGDDAMVDLPCPQDLGLYECVVYLGENAPALSTNNADSFAHFAVAMYLNKWNWSQGFPVAVGL
ncbi:hypothetical protein BJX63DRAFT_429745 [Aspergillus granulosus]|uniref:Uncharacterized protein n=1 Tax=Aspergillus granulosus TaxID=176169 RepID=A0ABR4HPD8_9EURO